MSTTHRAIHVRTGSADAVQAVNGWLARHGIDVTTCADALEACTFLVKNGVPAPELVFVGADWLAAEEFAILRYLRETWPGAAIVLYGEGIPPTAAATEPRLLVCPSAAALRAALASAPGQLLARARGAPPSREPLASAAPPRPAPAIRSAAGSPASGVQRGSPQEQGCATPLPEGRSAPLSRTGRPPIRAARATLTPEELSLLLEESND